jgi:hypothetical protein
VVPRWFSLGLIVVIFVIALLFARRAGPKAMAATETEATGLLKDQSSGDPRHAR